MWLWIMIIVDVVNDVMFFYVESIVFDRFWLLKWEFFLNLFRDNNGFNV